MKVQFGKSSESQGQVNSKSDKDSAQQPNDFFADIIANLTSAPTTQAKKDETKDVTSEVNKQQNQDITRDDKVKFNALLYGLDPALVQQTINDKQGDDTQKSSLDMIKANSQQKNEALVQINLNQIKSLGSALDANGAGSLQTVNNQEAAKDNSTSGSKEISNMIAALNISNLDQTNELTQVASPHELSQIESLQQSDQQSQQQTEQQANQQTDQQTLQQMNTHQHQYDVNNAKQSLPSLTKYDDAQSISNDAIVLNINPLPIAPEKISTLPSGQKNQINAFGDQKYANALTQLGQFVNTQTTQTFMSDASVHSDSTQQLDYKEMLNKTNQADYELKIDLAPVSLDSLGKEIHNAHIKIYPPELGSMLARLKVGKNGTELEITTENSRVKEIVEANLGQLRENFQRAEINLTNIQINVQTPESGAKDQQSQHQQDFASSGKSDINPLNQHTTATKPVTQKLDSIIDTYA